jgi:hypothetical protein
MFQRQQRYVTATRGSLSTFSSSELHISVKYLDIETNLVHLKDKKQESVVDCRLINDRSIKPMFLREG